MSFELIHPFKSISALWNDGHIPSRYEGHSGKLSLQKVRYLDEYLDKLGAKTAIVEHEYVDRNFMDDFCGYYARCFTSYPKKCERIHFFSLDFSTEELKKGVLNTDAELRKKICSHYLGFIVIRPVPGAHFGRVCLATYPPESGKCRIFPVLKSHEVHFQGLPLFVNTVAFQEQDNVISACATSAVWSALHAVREIGLHNVPSSFRITSNAKRIYQDISDVNVLEKGLTPAQMSAAITEEGYEPVLTSFSLMSRFKALARAYLNVGLPLILGVTLAHENEEKYSKEQGQNPVIGEHAVSVMGYNMADTRIKPFNQGPVDPGTPPLYLLSSAINKFYVHDDQVGPFASMLSRDEYWERLETHWNYYTNKEDKINAAINTVLIPCFKKIRIRFPIIENFVRSCNTLFAGAYKTEKSHLMWDIRLYSVNDFKAEVAEKESRSIDDEEVRYKLLCMKLPRFIWVADALCMISESQKEGQKERSMIMAPVATYILDATDMDRSDYFLCGYHYTQLSFALFRAMLESRSKEEREGFLEKRQSAQLVLQSLMEAYLNADTEKVLLPADAPITLDQYVEKLTS